MHTVGNNGLYDLFRRSNEPRSEHAPHFDDFRVLKHTIFWVIRIPTSIMPNFFVDVRQDLVYPYGWPSRLVRPIWSVKRAPKRAYASFRRFSYAIAHHFLGDPDYDVKNAKFSWTFVKTLSLHTVGHHGLSGPLGGSNEPRTKHTPNFDDFRVLKHTIFWVIRIPT